MISRKAAKSDSTFAVIEEVKSTILHESTTRGECSNGRSRHLKMCQLEGKELSVKGIVWFLGQLVEKRNYSIVNKTAASPMVIQDSQAY